MYVCGELYLRIGVSVHSCVSECICCVCEAAWVQPVVSRGSLSPDIPGVQPESHCRVVLRDAPGTGMEQAPGHAGAVPSRPS